ncbi:MAG: hypothetical protein QM757_26320 [Paludibaculum sp.]
MDQEPKDKLDLNRLRARLGERPRTKAGQVRQAWPDIKALFEAGHSLKDIWTWLNEIGIEIGYARLSHYTGQLRRRDRAAAQAESVASGQGGVQAGERRQPAPVEGESAEFRQDENLPSLSADPLANIREREGRHSGFHYNPDPDIKKLI